MSNDSDALKNDVLKTISHLRSLERFHCATGPVVETLRLQLDALIAAAKRETIRAEQAGLAEVETVVDP